MRAIQQAYWMSLSEEERLRRCGRLFATAKQFVEARAPLGIGALEKKLFVFKEMYGFDMPGKDDDHK